MRISFDIDNTLICIHDHAPQERGLAPLFLHRRLCEPLRQGTRVLFQELRRRGFSIWIYTTSGRTPFQIWLWLFLHGLRADGVVNEQRHRTELVGRRFARFPSKYPPAFGIDLHIDDSEGVRLEGEEHGFRVLVVRPENEGWAKLVLEAAEQVMNGGKACPKGAG